MPTPKGKAPLSAATAEFGRRVRERRNELGLSQEALAVAADLHWTFVGQVERGQRNLTLHNIVKIAAAVSIRGSLLPALEAAPWQSLATVLARGEWARTVYGRRESRGQPLDLR